MWTPAGSPGRVQLFHVKHLTPGARAIVSRETLAFSSHYLDKLALSWHCMLRATRQLRLAWSAQLVKLTVSPVSPCGHARGLCRSVVRLSYHMHIMHKAEYYA